MGLWVTATDQFRPAAPTLATGSGQRRPPGLQQCSSGGPAHAFQTLSPGALGAGDPSWRVIVVGLAVFAAVFRP